MTLLAGILRYLFIALTLLYVFYIAWLLRRNTE
jgi:hypothetical protein